MWYSLYNWFSRYYTNIRNIAELFYFIVLTGVMAYYAAKTYKKSVEAKPELLVHVYIDYKDRLERGRSCYPLYLEIYNNGTGIARNIVLSTGNQKLRESFSIFDTDLGFLQPQQSKFIPIGSLILTRVDNYISLFNDEIEKDDIKDINFDIKYNEKKEEKLKLNFEYVLNMPFIVIGKTSEESTQEKQLKQIATNINAVKSSIDTLSKKIR